MLYRFQEQNDMDSHNAKVHEGERALGLVKWLADYAIDGVRPLSSARDLANQYLRNQSYRDHRQRIDALINWETSKNFTSGFVTGLGGLLTLPVALPAGFAASWVLQARMAAAIAGIYGHDLRSERVRTLIVGTLIGDSIAEIATASGIRLGTGIGKSVADRVSRRGVIEFSRRVGSRLLAIAGRKSSVNLMKGVPLIGGLAGGTLDAVACRIVGKHARKLFATTSDSVPAKKRPARRTDSQRGGESARKRPRNTPPKKSAAKSSGAKSPAKKSSGGKSSARKSPGRKPSGRKKPTDRKSTAATKRRRPT